MSDIPNSETIDVLIIGSGASGAAAAWRLSDTGLKIMCLEQGDFMDASKYPSTGRDWELRRQADYHPSPNIRNLDVDFPVNDHESPIAISYFCAVGGSTILYSGHFPRLHPSDFKTKTLDGVGDDWPISYEDLEPFYKLNDKMVGVSGLSGDPAYPPIDGMHPPVPLGSSGEKIARGFNKLGWHWWPSYSAIITRNFKNRAKCINLGPCNTGCPQGAKGSADITYWPEAMRNGVQLKTRSRVSRITVNEARRATGAYYFDAEGREHFQAARLVIVACNGVGTPRLLLNSHCEQFPDGLANSSGLVGKNLMLHPLGYVEGRFKDKVYGHLGPQGSWMLSQQFYETDPARGFMRGFTMQALRGLGPIDTAVSGLLRNEIPWGEDHHDAYARTFGHTIGMAVITEDLPDQRNAVTIDPELKDNQGIPAPKVNYKISDNTNKIMTFGMERAKEVMKASGSVSEFALGPVRMAGWHLLGTARMGDDPRTSVVNKNGQTHDVENLYIIDGSIFVTSGSVNSASTIGALALYISSGIRRKLRELI